MALAGVRSHGEPDYPLQINESVTPLPFHYGSTITMTAGEESTLAKVSDLRRFENMEEVVRGTHTGATSTTTLTDSNADFIDWGIQVGDEVTNVTDSTSAIIDTVTATTLTTDGVSWDQNDVYTIDKKVSHQFARAIEIRRLSIRTNEDIYVRFDGSPSATLYDVRISRNEGYFIENIRIAVRIAALGVSDTSTPEIDIVVWGI